MAERLVKIAKELNVATSTIVEYLTHAGFEIENKPTSKVSEDMYVALQKEFSSSVAEKEKADKLIIGRVQVPKKEEVKPPVTPPTYRPPVVQTPVNPVEPIKEVEQAPVTEVKEVKETVTTEKPNVPGLKILGKIDLEANNRPKRQEQPKVEDVKVEPKVEVKIEVKEEPVIKEVIQEEEKPTITESKETSNTGDSTTDIADESEEVSIIRVDAPQLAGLKILGKVDTSKFGNEKSKKEKEKKKKDDKKKEMAAKAAKTGPNRPIVPAKQPGTASGDASNDDNKRKRTRKKVSAANYKGNNTTPGAAGASRPKKKIDEVKEVSAKEIEDKIKSTMAKMGRLGKSKRQKIRRENRDDKKEKQDAKDLEAVTDVIELTEFISVSELSNLLDVSVSEVITTCMNLGVIVSINQRLDAEIIELVAQEFDREVTFISTEEENEEIEEIIDDPKDLIERAPIVTVMGHVDHGKTSLLDFVRQANVASGEAGGITQHIGAYEVLVGPESKRITFLDTPGHEAFTAMRARGAKVTDIAIIIVAADDRIMPQTKEAISHAQAAGVPIVFAINKIDKAGADPERIKAELSGMNFLVESYGGKYQSQDISAKNGTGIEELLEKILLEAEILDLKANPNREAIGTVIEASLDKGRGYVTKILVQNGTINIGDVLVAGEHAGKIKALYNETGKRVKTVGPSQPVLVLGLGGAPQAGEKFKVMESEQDARQIASRRAQIAREQSNRASKRISLDEIGRRLALGSFKELNLIVKGDVDGSIEALADSLIKLSLDSVQVNVIHKAVGQIAESDVLLASASDAIIIGFQVRPSINARNIAEREGVEIKMYSIIYEAIEEIKMAIEGLLEPTKEEKIIGQVEIRETYKISKLGTIAGCYVLEGKLGRNTKIRIIRDGIVIYPNKEGQVGEISSLKRYKEDVKEVKSAMECGISIKNFNDIKPGDIIEGYEIIEIKQTYG